MTLEMCHSHAPRAVGKTSDAEELLLELEKFYIYDSLHGGFIVMNRKQRDGHCKNPGCEAATKCWRNRNIPMVKVMWVAGKRWSESALVWLWNFGELPGANLEMDHISRDPWDNRIENLRVVSHNVNLQNLTKRSNNSSGVTGVNYEPAIGKYRARVTFQRKTYYAGVHESIENAIAARQKILAHVNAIGASFTATHGED